MPNMNHRASASPWPSHPEGLVADAGKWTLANQGKGRGPQIGPTGQRQILAGGFEHEGGYGVPIGVKREAGEDRRKAKEDRDRPCGQDANAVDFHCDDDGQKRWRKEDRRAGRLGRNDERGTDDRAEKPKAAQWPAVSAHQGDAEGEDREDRRGTGKGVLAAVYADARAGVAAHVAQSKADKHRDQHAGKQRQDESARRKMAADGQGDQCRRHELKAEAQAHSGFARPCEAEDAQERQQDDGPVAQCLEDHLTGAQDAKRDTEREEDKRCQRTDRWNEDKGRERKRGEHGLKPRFDLPELAKAKPGGIGMGNVAHACGSGLRLFFVVASNCAENVASTMTVARNRGSIRREGAVA